MPERGQCAFCGENVEEFHAAAFRVRGWEVERPGQGGANMITGKERQPDRIAHASCVRQHFDRQKQGIIPGQQSLI